jgi:hypothetical protein
MSLLYSFCYALDVQGPPDRRNYLQRLILGLEQTVDNLKFEIPYYKPDDLQLKYAKKFLASAEENLAEAKAELDALIAKDGPPPGPKVE